MRALAAIASATIAAAVLGSAAAADGTPVTISIPNCVFKHGGQMTVPAGSTITFRAGWVARTAGLDSGFLKDLSLDASVDGAPIAAPMSYWSAPAPIVTTSGQNAYVTWWLYPTGRTLQSGDSTTIVWSGVLRHPIADGLTPGAARGDVLGGHDTCTVAAS